MNDKEFLDTLRQLNVLYVEDEESIRNEVAYFLERRVGKLLTAANGKEGLELFKSKRPDLVISDIQMPMMNGLEMAGEIKRLDRATPVVLATAFSDTQYLQTAISHGVDGYVLKPINLEVMMKTLQRAVEIMLQAREVIASRARLAAYHRGAEEERRLVASLMARMMRPAQLKDPQVQYWLQPTDLIGGDLIAVARGRANKLYAMLADSTGHGLPAALNLLPINHIFYSMVSKNLPVSLMVEEMNWAVHDQSPVDRYVAAIVVCIDPRNRLIEIWNGALPNACFVDTDGRVAHVFESRNLPLGILDRTFVAETEVLQWNQPGSLVFHSDGLEDAESETGEMFGHRRIGEIVANAGYGNIFGNLVAAVQQHLNGRPAGDDMTLAVIETEAPQ